MEEDIPKSTTDEELGTQRGFISEEEVHLINSLVLEKDIEASKQLLLALTRPDSEGSVKASSVWKIINSKDNGCWKTLLELGLSGALKLYTEVNRRDVTTGAVIGKGHMSVVYMGNYKGRDVAVKMMHFTSQKASDDFKKVLSHMCLLREPSLLVHCYGYAKGSSNFILTELMEGSVFYFLHNKNVEITDHIRLIMAISIAKGIEYIHSCNIIHQNLKTTNLLVSKYFEIKITDFGGAGNSYGKCIPNVSCVSPEIFVNWRTATDKSDVYSFAIILWELLTRQRAWDDIEMFSIPLKVVKGKRPKLPKESPKEWKKLIKKCWDPKPEKRPDMSKVLLILNEMWVTFHQNQGGIETVAFKVAKYGEELFFDPLNEKQAEELHYPPHAIWRPLPLLTPPETNKKK